MAATTDDLARVSLFSTLSERQRKKLAKLFHERTVPAGTKLVTEGTMSGVGFFVVADGEARVTVGDSEVGRLGPGDHFGELALVSEAERSAPSPPRRSCAASRSPSGTSAPSRTTTRT